MTRFARAQAWRKRAYDLSMGIGIAQGFATIGAIGFEGRRDYSAIGTVCNLAARLCAEAKGGQILVSQRVQVATESIAKTESIGDVSRLPDQATYATGTNVQLTATAATGYRLAGWSGDASGTANPLTVVLNGNLVIGAAFVPEQFTVTVTVTGRGSVTRDPDLPLYDYGAGVSLSATPDAGYAFTGWSGAPDPLANPLAITIDGPQEIGAAFAPGIALVGPNGGEAITIGSPLDIRWSVAAGVPTPSIDILLSRQGGAGPFETLASALPNTGLYTWSADSPATDSAFVRVVVHDADGQTGEARSAAAFSIHGVLDVAAGRHMAYGLDPVSPNPAAGAARIDFALPEAASVRVSILDLQGREVARLAEGRMSAGRHRVTWSPARGRGVGAPGVYLVRFQTPEGVHLRRLVLER